MPLQFDANEFKFLLEELGFPILDEDNLRTIYNVNECTTKPMTIIVYRNGSVHITGSYTDKLSFIDGHREDIFYDYSYSRVNDIINKNNKHLELPSYIGSDESGTGNSFGGICVAGVVIKDRNDIILLRGLKVKDSKKLSNKRLFSLSEKISKFFKTYYIYLTPNQIRYYFNRYGLNMTELVYLLHLEIYSYLSEYSGITNFVLDGYISKSSKMIELEKECNLPKNANLYRIPKADDMFYGVSAASIIATAVCKQQLYKVESKLGTRLYATDYKSTEGVIRSLVSLGCQPLDYCKDNRNTINSIRKVLNENK